MTECYLVTSLTDDGGKWEPGTILHAFPLDHVFGAGDMASFHIERIETGKYSIDDLKAMRCRKVLDLSELVDAETMAAKLEQKDNVRFEMVSREVVSVTVGEITIKPDFSTTTRFDDLSLSDCQEKYIPKPIDVEPTESLHPVNGVR